MHVYVRIDFPKIDENLYHVNFDVCVCMIIMSIYGISEIDKNFVTKFTYILILALMQVD